MSRLIKCGLGLLLSCAVAAPIVGQQSGKHNKNAAKGPLILEIRCKNGLLFGPDGANQAGGTQIEFDVILRNVGNKTGDFVWGGDDSSLLLDVTGPGVSKNVFSFPIKEERLLLGKRIKLRPGQSHTWHFKSLTFSPQRRTVISYALTKGGTYNLSATYRWTSLQKPAGNLTSNIVKIQMIDLNKVRPLPEPPILPPQVKPIRPIGPFVIEIRCKNPVVWGLGSDALESDVIIRNISDRPAEFSWGGDDSSMGINVTGAGVKRIIRNYPVTEEFRAGIRIKLAPGQSYTWHFTSLSHSPSRGTDISYRFTKAGTYKLSVSFFSIGMSISGAPTSAPIDIEVKQIRPQIPEMHLPPIAPPKELIPFKHLAKQRALQPRTMAYSNNGAILALAGKDGTVTIWDVKNGKMLHTLKGDGYAVQAVALSADGKILGAGATDATVKVWDTTTGRLLRKLRDRFAVHAVAISPNGKYIAAASSGSYRKSNKFWQEVRIWNVKTGKLVSTQGGSMSRAVPDPYSFGTSIEFTPDGEGLAIGGEFLQNGNVTIVFFTKRCPPENYEFRGTGRIERIAFANNGNLMAVFGTDTMRVMNRETGKELPVPQNVFQFVR